MSERHYAVDRISSEQVIVVDDEGRARSVPLRQFKRGIAETMVLRVPLDEAGEPNWLAAEVDMGETERRARRSASFLRVLEEQDW